ncbi:MAG TPA: prepilin peptidase [Alphaproteobacteria bacterium]|nr:prepilin peptidase [Alphaproteobacteria bacterium]
MPDVPFFDDLWFKLIVGYVIGLALGSFVTMLSYRLPRRLSIATAHSQCPNCHRPLRARDLVPIFSWGISGGKCRYCKTPISARYPLIELVTATLSAIAMGYFGFQWAVLGAFAVIIFAVTLVTVDIEDRD